MPNDPQAAPTPPQPPSPASSSSVISPSATTQTSPPPSTPLATVEQDSLSELFSRDPLSLGQQDLDRIILSFREQRARFAANEAAGIKPHAGAKAKANKVDLAGRAKAPTATLEILGLAAKVPQ